MHEGVDRGHDNPQTGLRLAAWTALVVGVLINLTIAFLRVVPQVIAEVPRLQELTAWWPDLPTVPGPPLLLQLASGIPAVLAAGYLVWDRARRRSARR
ncbi:MULTISPECIES: hypothetical protein [unclassified Isoptericola]|uniref:hypothetical protein n=1 Tax=unclassified Isoptericola TaxID=2623355 RepID=UPI0036527341